MNRAMERSTLVIGLLIAGTGSIYPIENARLWQNHLENRSSLGFEKRTSIEKHVDVRTVKEHIENIRMTLNPSIAELAALFGVSRQAIYKWLSQNSHPEADKFEHIKLLSKIADLFTAAGIQRANILLNMKNSQGKSLYDLLKAKQPYEEQLKMLIAEAQVMEAQRSGLTQSSAKSTNDWLSSISIPPFYEDF